MIQYILYELKTFTHVICNSKWFNTSTYVTLSDSIHLQKKTFTKLVTICDFKCLNKFGRSQRWKARKALKGIVGDLNPDRWINAHLCCSGLAGIPANLKSNNLLTSGSRPWCSTVGLTWASRIHPREGVDRFHPILYCSKNHSASA